MTVLVARTKTVLFKERHKQTHKFSHENSRQLPEHMQERSQHQQMILWGMVIFLAFV